MTRENGERGSYGDPPAPASRPRAGVSARPAPAALLVAVILLAWAAVAGAAAAGGRAEETVTVTGWIVDDVCKAGNASANGVACTRKCHKDGARLMLYDPKAKRIYDLETQELAARNIGHVTVSGRLREGDLLVIETIEVSEPADAAAAEPSKPGGRPGRAPGG